MRGELIAALGLRWLGLVSDRFLSDLYYGWDGRSERVVDWQSGCCVLFRGDLLRKLGGFDDRFFYHCEEPDLCHRVRIPARRIGTSREQKSLTWADNPSGGFRPLYSRNLPQSLPLLLQTLWKTAVINLRRVTLLHLGLRRFVYSVVRLARPTEALKNRLTMYKVAIRWNEGLDPVKFVESGLEPDLGYSPLAPAPSFSPLESVAAK